MPAVACPIEGCAYVTPDMDAIIAAALITAHATTHNTTSNQMAAVKVEKVKRPTISSAGTSEEWTYFISRWNDYVEATKLTGKDKTVQLLECCDEQLRKDLTRNAGGTLTGQTEQVVLKAIRALAVREENTMVARVALHNMRQDRDETIRSFGARLRGQAGVCKFVTKCPQCDSDVSYTEAILRDVLSRGLEDPEIQLDLLGDKDQEMTIEKVFQFVEAKEPGKRSASRLLDSHGAEAASAYRRDKATAQKTNQRKDNNPHRPDKSEICTYCGKKGHGKCAFARLRKRNA